MRKRIKGLFLTLIFSIQLLPLMQVGALLAKSQLTEEECFIEDNAPTDGDFFYSSVPLEVCIHHFLLPLISMRVNEEYVDSRHADDIQTPPPNV